MNLADLQTFSLVAQTGTISAAARRLGVPKSTVSRRVRRLEDALGNELLRRGRLTPEQVQKVSQKNALTRAVGVYRTVPIRSMKELQKPVKAGIFSFGAGSESAASHDPASCGERRKFPREVVLGALLAFEAARQPGGAALLVRAAP